MATDYLLDVGNTPLNPDTHIPLMEMAYSRAILEDKFASAGGLNFFSPVVDDSWRNDLPIHHSIRIRFKNYQNPFNIVGVTEVEYQDDQSCPPVLDDLCDPGTISTENSWRYEDVRFKNKFRVGVRWCVENEKLLYQDGEDRFGESVEASRIVIATIGWSELITQAIASDTNTLLPTFTLSAKHYFDAGNQDRVDVMTLVIQYMQRVYGPRWASEFGIFVDPQFELDILASGSNLHDYDTTGLTSANANHNTLVAGGFRPMTALPRGLWGKPIYVAPDVVDYYPTDGPLAGSNLNPFRSADGSSYYVVIASKRSFFHGAVTLMDKRHFPATEGNKYESIQQTWLSYYKLLFPKEVFIVAFDQAGFVVSVPTIATALPSGAAAGATVTLKGTGFNGVTGVTIGGTAVTSFDVINNTTLEIVVPAGSAGSAPIVVTNGGGASASKAYTRGA